MRHWTAECIYRGEAALGEAPHWHAESGRLLWVDIERGEVHALDPATGEDQRWEVGTEVGCVLPSRRGDFVLATRNGFQRLDPETGAVAPLSDPEAGQPNHRFNDGKCDPRGRLWAGTMSDARTPGAAKLYVLEPDLSVRVAVSEVTTSNGLAWSQDERSFYYVDSPTFRVDAFDFEPETGAVSNRRSVAEFPSEGNVKPDGMTIDADDRLWIALFRGGRVTCVDPHRGVELGSVALPCAKVTSCCFGGPDLATLYITTARTGLAAAELDDQPDAGGIFACDVGVRGLPAAIFAG